MASTPKEALRQDLLPHLLVLMSSQESPITYQQLLEQVTAVLGGGTLEGNDLDSFQAPEGDLASPVMQNLFDAWTGDVGKKMYLQKWLAHIVDGHDVDDDFQCGIELTRLPVAVRDGFLKLVVPLLRRRGDVRVTALSREQADVWPVKILQSTFVD